jgi:hypothetical protein
MAAKEKVTLTLPKNLMNEVRALAPARGHSQFIADAIEFFIRENQRRKLRERLIAGYQTNAGVDADLAAEWSVSEDESWSLHVPPYEVEEPVDDASH